MGASMMRIAQEKGILDFKAHDLRDWTHDRHRTTDDEPYGGGDGLVMKCAPIFEAYESLCDATGKGSIAAPAESAQGEGAAASAEQVPCEGSDSDVAEQALSDASAAPADRRGSKPYTIFLAPQGRRFDDACACELAAQRAPAVRLRPLRGHRRASLRVGRRGHLAGRLRAHQRRAGLHGGHRRRGAQAPRRPGRRDGRLGRELRRRLVGIPAVHAPVPPSTAWRCRRCCCPATTARSTDGAASRASSAPIACAPTCSRAWSCPTPTGHLCNLYRPKAGSGRSAVLIKQLSAYRAPLARAL